MLLPGLPPGRPPARLWPARRRRPRVSSGGAARTTPAPPARATPQRRAACSSGASQLAIHAGGGSGGGLGPGDWQCALALVCVWGGGASQPCRNRALKCTAALNPPRLPQHQQPSNVGPPTHIHTPHTHPPTLASRHSVASTRLPLCAPPPPPPLPHHPPPHQPHPHPTRTRTRTPPHPRCEMCENAYCEDHLPGGRPTGTGTSGGEGRGAGAPLHGGRQIPPAHAMLGCIRGGGAVPAMPTLRPSIVAVVQHYKRASMCMPAPPPPRRLADGGRGAAVPGAHVVGGFPGRTMQPAAPFPQPPQGHTCHRLSCLGVVGLAAAKCSSLSCLSPASTSNTCPYTGRSNTNDTQTSPLPGHALPHGTQPALSPRPLWCAGVGAAPPQAGSLHPLRGALQVRCVACYGPAMCTCLRPLHMLPMCVCVREECREGSHLSGWVQDVAASLPHLLKPSRFPFPRLQGGCQRPRNRPCPCVPPPPPR